LAKEEKCDKKKEENIISEKIQRGMHLLLQ